VVGYRVTAIFEVAVETSAPDLETAARTASKMADQGGSEIIVYADGEMVPQHVLDRSFRDYAARTLADRGQRPPDGQDFDPR
jgi:hypothetical protein